jgi:hypothetical protein
MIDFQKQQKEIIEKMDLLFNELSKLNSDLTAKLSHDANLLEDLSEVTKEVTFLSLFNKEVTDKLTSDEYKDLVVMSSRLNDIELIIDKMKCLDFKEKMINIIDKFYKAE